MSIIGDSKEEDYEVFTALKKVKQMRRRIYGIPCPTCQKQRPKAQPKILLPQQKCFDGYRDPRPRITREQDEALWKAQGFEKVEKQG